MSWLRDHASPPLRLRTLTEILPPDSSSEDEVALVREEVAKCKGVTEVVRKQRDTGLWAANILATGPSKTLGVTDVGTVYQYRRLLELGIPSDHRALQLTNRVFFRLLSRDEDPKLLFEYKTAAKTNPAVPHWARVAMQEAACGALAQAGHHEDPRLRGAADRVITSMSRFFRSEVSSQPIVRKGTKYLLDPDAYPPTLHSVAILAYQPTLQRERGTVVDRLGRFLAEPPPKEEYMIAVGKKTVKPQAQLLGDPIQLDSDGRPRDLPFALHWMELLARLNMFEHSASAQRGFFRLIEDCDGKGVWAAKGLRGFPKSQSGLVSFYFPLEADEKSRNARLADVTFRLALIAKLAGLELDLV